MATARNALLNDLLPALPKDRRYAGLMIANVMAIAAREHRSGGDAIHGEAQRLARLLADLEPDAATTHTDSTGAELPKLRRALASAIRLGYFDDPRHQRALRVHIARTAADWVAISNPKALR